MLLAPWLKLFVTRLTRIYFGSRRTSKTKLVETNSVPSRRCRALSFERLEDRTLLATLTVNSLADNTTAADGLVTLREAVMAANENIATDLGEVGEEGHDEIVFQTGLNGFIETTGSSGGGKMEVTEDLTVVGNGRENTTLLGGTSGRFFDVSGVFTNLTVRNITLRGGSPGSPEESGGAIRSLAVGANTITVVNSTLTGNSTRGNRAAGGAIYSAAGSIVITDSTITSNANRHSNEGSGAGGAIFAGLGSVTITNSEISNNSTGGLDAEGGAIYTVLGAVTIINSTVTGNRTTNDSGEGGAVFSNLGKVTIVNSTFSENRTTGDGAEGGAIAAFYGPIEVVNSTFHGNYTTGGSSEGGAIFSHRGAITIVNSTLSGNQTQSDGGGIFAVYSDVTIVNSTITGNSAAGRGGGIDFFPNAYDGESLTIHNSIVAGNSAATNPDFTIPGGPAGSLEVRYSLIGDNEGTTLIEAQSRDVNGNFIGDADSGGVIDPRLATLQDNGGATLTHDLLPNSLAFNGGDNTLAVDPTDFDSPLTTDQRGPSFVRSFAGRVDMGAVESRDLTGRFVVDSAADVVDGNITNGHRSLREVVDLANRTFGVDTVTFAPALDGTALLLTSGQIDILEGIDFVGNGTANTIIDAQQNSRIFAIAGFRNNVTLDSLTLQNGRTTAGLDKGGAVVVGGLSTLHATRSRITGSSTAGTNAEGGAIAAVYGNVVLVDSTLSGNWTSGLSGEGGAVFSRYGTITVRGSTLHANFTTGESSEGGAIAAFNGNVTIVNSTLSGNRVEGGDTFGGGGLFADAGDVVVVNSTITGNSAPRAGGLEIYPNDNGESLTVYNSIIAGNLAATNPDFTAPANPGANLTVRFSLIGNNSGTMLAEDQSGSSGNFIGGGTAGTAINPLLAPLADNGGPTQTHALLPGSLALNTGNNALAVDHIMSPLTSDQRGAPFHRIFGSAVDIGAFEDQALLITGNNAFLTGTVNPDSIVYRVGNGQININGVTYVLPSNIKMLQVDALEGSDVLNLIGTSGNESGLTRPGTVFFEHDSTHAGFDFTAVNVEIAILDGNGGTDTLTLRDPATTSDDKFFARPNSAVMFAADGSYQSNAFGFITTGIFGDGNDLLRFSDSPDNDTLTASPGLATFTGPTFSHSAQNFDVLVAVSLNGVDTANLTGTAGVDALLARAGVAVMSGTGFNFQLDSFETVNSNGLGSSDLVRFLGSAGDDLLNANPTSASFVTGGFTINTVSIERLIATAGSGANDVAILTDSAGNDTFSGTVSVGTLQGAGFFEQTTNFDVIRIRGVNGGVNTRTLNNIAFTLIEQGTWT